MNRFFLYCVVILSCFSCAEKDNEKLLEGIWLTELKISDNEVLPFNFKLIKKDNENYSIEIYNAAEVILVDEVAVKNDSITIYAPVFEGYLAGTFTKDRIEGNFIKEGLDRVVPFKAYHGITERFRGNIVSNFNSTGTWKTEFSPNTEDSYLAKGIFSQEGNKITGTFRTTTGDYRYLEGKAIGDSIKLSAFDGGHAFLFTAKVSDSSLQGTFYSGNHFKEPFTAIRDAAFELPDANSLTFLKEGYEGLDFSFPDTNGNIVSLKDDEFKDKVVLVQIMGTWCPNCLDETKFYVDFLKKNPNKDIKVVALAFEYAKTEEKAIKNIERLKNRIGVTYPVLLAQYGTSDKAVSQQKLPMLNHILSYPTSIFIDKKGAIRKIHTGFNGPAAGEKHTEFTKEFNVFVDVLLTE